MQELNPVMILGAGGIGKLALEIFQSNGVVVYGFLDDNNALHGTEIDIVPIYGNTDDDGYLKLIGKKCDAFVAVDDNRLRKRLTEMLLERRKVMPVNAIHKSAVYPQALSIGHGNLIYAGVCLAAGVQIGNHTLLHTGATVDYDTVIYDFAQLGVGAVIGSNCVVEEGAFIGSGAVIVSGVKIGKNARVGAGSVVIADVASGVTVFGNPAQPINK